MSDVADKRPTNDIGFVANSGALFDHKQQATTLEWRCECGHSSALSVEYTCRSMRTSFGLAVNNAVVSRIPSRENA